MVLKGLKRSKTEIGDGAPATTASSSIASSSAARSKKSKRRKFPLARFRRLKSAPFGDQNNRNNQNDDNDDEATPSATTAEDEGHSTTSGNMTKTSSFSRLNGLLDGSCVDDGAPSLSPLKDLRRVLKLIEDERHLVAHQLYLDVKRRVNVVVENDDENDNNSNNNNNDGERRDNAPRQQQQQKQRGKGNGKSKKNEDEKARMFLLKKREEFQALENRANLFSAAKENLSTDVDDDWIHAQTIFGITTSYRREADGSLSVKIEGELHGIPLFEQLVVLRECDLYHTWAPFMSKSNKLAQLDKLDVVAWYSVGVPLLGLTRDACYRAVGCDCMREDGKLLLVAVGLNDTEEYGVKDSLLRSDPAKAGKGSGDDPSNALQQREMGMATASSDSILIDTTNSSFLARDAILSTLEIPPIPEGLGKGRMTIRNFAASIDILTPTAARTKMVVNVDPNLHLIPQFMIDFCMKRMAGILLSRLQATARKVVKDPIKNAHAQRMREDVRFYRDWLLPKFQLYCDELGWQMPKVGAFEIDLEAEGMSWIDDTIDNSNVQLETTTQQYPSEGDDTSCLGDTTDAGSVSSYSSKSTHFLKNLVRKKETPEEKIAAARQALAKRLRPQPFSESKVHRLKELKMAKMMAEDRRQAKCLVVGSSSGESVSSFNTQKTLQDLDDEEDVVKRCVLLFGSSLLVHSTLLIFRRFEILIVAEWTNNRASQESLDFVMICLQSIALWALLSGALIYSFDEIDLGQKRLVSNMNYAKKLYAKEVKNIALLISISVAVASYGFGLVSGSINWFCALADIGSLSFLWDCLHRVDLRHLLSTLQISDDGINTLERLAITFIDTVATIWRHVGFTFAWIMLKLSWIMARPMKVFPNSAYKAFSGFAGHMSLSNWRICESSVAVSKPWGSRALDISSFVTLRLGVFVWALMFMGHLLLPKPEKKVNKKSESRVDGGTKQVETDSGNSSVASSLNESIRSFGASGNVGSMEAITEEDS